MAKASEERKLRPPVVLQTLRPGTRLAVAVSGGADSVALLRLLAAEREALGLVLHVAHMHHGLRGEEADRDAAFVEALAGQLKLPLLKRDADTAGAARTAGAGLEETARKLRYGWFAELLASGALDAIATAHTLDDQAETVLLKLLRGAWTEGLGGIGPVVEACDLPGAEPDGAQPTTHGMGRVIRPLLGATRGQIVRWLTAIGQSWQQDTTNADLSYTRNRIRHALLPELAAYNPQIAAHLAQVAALARDDESYWEREVARLLPGLLMPGRPARRGGRAGSSPPGERVLAVEVERLRALHPALRRRVLRGAARELGVRLNFEQTARLCSLLDAQIGGRREQLTGELLAERTPRELRLRWSSSKG